MLSKEIKDKVMDAISEVDIDVYKLNSAHYSSFYHDWEYDEDEFFYAQMRKFMEYIEEGGVCEYIKVDEDVAYQDAEDRKLTDEVLDWLVKMYNEGGC